MKIVLIDPRALKVMYLDVDDTLITGYVSDWLEQQGYDIDHLECFATKEKDCIPCEFHRYKKSAITGNVVHVVRKENLRFGSPGRRARDIKDREREECFEKLKKYGKHSDGFYSKDFDKNFKPCVAGYLYDEPCDIIVNKVKADEDNGQVTLIGYEKNDSPSTETEISARELFAGQLNEITEMI